MRRKVVGRYDLLTLGYEFAALVFKSAADKDWLRRRFTMLEDILEESWAYQELKEKATRQATKQVTENVTKQVTENVTKQVTENVTKQVTENVTKQVTQHMLIFLVEKRFPELVPLAKSRADFLNDQETSFKTYAALI